MSEIENEKSVGKHGGMRKGAGRKIGTGKFGEPTSVLRVPLSQSAKIKDFLSAYQQKRIKLDIDSVGEFEYPSIEMVSIPLPLYSSKVSAGLPSPADEHIEKRLDPSEFLIDRKDSTFFVTIQGYSMMDAGLLPGDKAVVDRSKLASVGDTGLLDKLQPTDDELAQVMGHEISHALANHTAEKMSVDILTKIAVAAVTVAVAASDQSTNQSQRRQNVNTTQDVAILAGAAFVTLPNSRGAETEADKLGIELAAQAGYDPQSAITLWEKMMAETGNKSKGDFMSTHPSPPNRIEAFQALQEPMQKIYKERAPLYVDYKPVYQYVIAAKDSAGFSSSNVRVITEGSALVEAPTVDATQVMAFYSPAYESFKQGTLELSCKNCSLKFYLNQSDFKKLYEKQDWRGLAQAIIKVGYEFDLSYYYLGEAAKGMGLVESSKAYFKKAKELSDTLDASCANAKMIKCGDIDISAIVVESQM